MSDFPPTKIEKTVYFGLCFICQTAIGPTDYTNFVLKPQLSSVEKLATCAEQQYTYGETKFALLNRRLQDSSAEELLAKGLRYHKVCYKDVTNKVHIDRVKARFEKGTTSGSVTKVRLKKRGRPASTDLSEGVSTPIRCAREQSFNKHRYASYVRKTQSVNCTMSPPRTWNSNLKILAKIQAITISK